MAVVAESPTTTRRLPLNAIPFRFAVVSAAPELHVSPASFGVCNITGELGPALLSSIVAFMMNAYCVALTRPVTTRGDTALKMSGTPGVAGTTELPG